MGEARVPGISPTSRQAYYQLAMTCKGTALGIVRAVERNNGVEAWRRLCQRYQPDAGPRMQQMMTRILTPGDFPDSVGGFEAALVAWEGLIEKWESASGNFLDEQVKVTVIMQKAPSTIRGFLQFQGITSYIRLREILVAYFLSQSTIADPMAGLVSGGGHQPMQVDALTKPKGKGKGKGKSKDKGKVAHNPGVVCYRCGRKGHYSRDCWSEQHVDGYPLDPLPKGKDKKGKGKGKSKVNEIGQNDIDQLRETVARLEAVSSSSSSTTMVRSLMQQAENYESQWQGGYVASVGQATH